MTGDEEPPALPPHVRIAAGAIRRLPAGWRKAYVRERRAITRRQRTRAERKGDRSRSCPALHAMDLTLAELLPAGGVFVEAGGNDGFEQSNTYLLERFHGWTGLLVEPVPELAAEARRNRPRARVIEAALVASDGPQTISMRFGGLMSVVAGSRGSAREEEDWVGAVAALGLEEPYTIDVPARTLSAVIDEAGISEVDLLSLDVEGYELSALRGLDMARHAPRFALVEVRDQAATDAVTQALGTRYRVERRLSPGDVLYRRVD